MIVFLWLLLILLLLILAIGLALSFYFTRRAQLGEVFSPDEYGLEFETIELKTSDKLTLRGVWIPAPEVRQSHRHPAWARWQLRFRRVPRTFPA